MKKTLGPTTSSKSTSKTRPIKAPMSAQKPKQIAQKPQPVPKKESVKKNPKVINLNFGDDEPEEAPRGKSQINTILNNAYKQSIRKYEKETEQLEKKGEVEHLKANLIYKESIKDVYVD